MPIVDLELLVKVDGQPLGGFPLSRRLSIAQLVRFDEQVASGGGDVSLPENPPLTAGQSLLVLTTDQAVTLKFNNLASCTLNANGLIIALDIAAANVDKVNNASGSAATVRGVAGGP